MLRRNGLAHVLNMDDMERAARRRLPKAVFDAVACGAGDEITLKANRKQFDQYWLRPHALEDISKRDLTTTVLGQEISLPLMLAPAHFARMLDSGAEKTVARAATKAGTIYAVPSGSSYDWQDVL